MITKESGINKICSFYASDFHLEMMMLPYINKKLEQNANIILFTQKDLEKSIKVLMSKINLCEEKKQKIANLNWSNHSVIKLEKIKPENEQVIFVIGDEKYIEQINQKIKDIKGKLTIVNCYDLEQVENKAKEIAKMHDKILNTTGEKII